MMPFAYEIEEVNSLHFIGYFLRFSTLIYPGFSFSAYFSLNHTFSGLSTGPGTRFCTIKAMIRR
jgi:hypothetical protein